MVVRYGPGADEGRRYTEDLKYWCNACGELHKWGMYDIKEEDLPEELRTMYNDRRWEDGKRGNYCYLVEYKGRYGIGLLNEFHEYVENKPYPFNYERAIKAAEAMDAEFADKGITVLIAEKQGFDVDGDPATEAVVFAPSDVDKDLLNDIALRFYKESFG